MKLTRKCSCAVSTPSTPPSVPGVDLKLDICRSGLSKTLGLKTISRTERTIALKAIVLFQLALSGLKGSRNIDVRGSDLLPWLQLAYGDELHALGTRFARPSRERDDGIGRTAMIDHGHQWTERDANLVEVPRGEPKGVRLGLSWSGTYVKKEGRLEGRGKKVSNGAR